MIPWTTWSTTATLSASLISFLTRPSAMSTLAISTDTVGGGDVNSPGVVAIR